MMKKAASLIDIFWIHTFLSSHLASWSDMEHISNAHFYCLENFDFEWTQNTQKKSTTTMVSPHLYASKVEEKKTCEKTHPKKALKKVFHLKWIPMAVACVCVRAFKSICNLRTVPNGAISIKTCPNDFASLRLQRKLNPIPNTQAIWNNSLANHPEWNSFESFRSTWMFFECNILLGLWSVFSWCSLFLFLFFFFNELSFLW